MAPYVCGYSYVCPLGHIRGVYGLVKLKGETLLAISLAPSYLVCGEQSEKSCLRLGKRKTAEEVRINYF